MSPPNDAARMRAVFDPLATAASASMPAPGFLSSTLSKVIQNKPVGDVRVPKEIGRAFGSASVDMWHRSIHSFLVSCAISHSSPVWSSVAGYYASHYAVRAIAHALGLIQLHSAKRIVTFQSITQCIVSAKRGNDREHQYYWNAVKSSDLISTDPWFCYNKNDGRADVSHRDFANYMDHVGLFPNSGLLPKDELGFRVDRISKLNITDPPTPQSDSFPRVLDVQILAYRRLVKYRRLMDEHVGNANRYWRVHRQPTWVEPYVNFQIATSDVLVEKKSS